MSNLVETLAKGIGIFVMAAGLVAVLSVLGAYPTKWLINYLCTPSLLVTLFGGPLTFWKALALNYVAASLFKGTVEVKK